MGRYILWLLGVVALATSCERTGYDQSTPESAHRSLVSALSKSDFEAVFPMISDNARRQLGQYIRNTDEIITTIRTQYPQSQQWPALNDLNFAIGETQFTYEEFESAGSDTGVFVALCEKIMTGKKGLIFPIQMLGADIQSVERPDSLHSIIVTAAQERIPYQKETDGMWHTGHPFEMIFTQLALMSRQNLEITRNNIEVFQK